MDLNADDTQWATRSSMWRARAEKASARRTKRAKPIPALTLAGHGVSLRIQGGALTIQNGFTHYPQQRETFRFFRGDLSLPKRIILLDGSGSISFDVLSWLAEQKVSLIRIDWKGDIVCVAGASGYSANPHRVRWQLETRENPEPRNEYCRSLITRKIEASILTLEKSIRRSDKLERAMKSAYSALTQLDENPPETISELRALEANCAASYFRSWVGMPIKWRGTNRRPIPDSWRSIGQRSSPYHLAGNQRAIVDDMAGLGILADHRGLHPVVEDLLRHAAERLEGGNVAAQQRRHVLVQHEAAPQHPAVSKYQREQPDDAHDAGLIGKLGLELGEVDLRLLPRRRLEA